MMISNVKVTKEARDLSLWKNPEQLSYTIKQLTESEFGRTYIDRVYAVPECCFPSAYFMLFFDGTAIPPAKESCEFCKNANNIVGRAMLDDTFRECEVAPIKSQDFEEWGSKAVLVWER